MPDIRPKNITLNREEKVLIIDWSAEESCRYPLSHLREACPCVECRGGHHNMGINNAPENLLVLKPARSYGVDDIQIVGNYALQFVWDDGHHTGIYTWEFLYYLCPDQQKENQSE